MKFRFARWEFFGPKDLPHRVVSLQGALARPERVLQRDSVIENSNSEPEHASSLFYAKNPAAHLISSQELDVPTNIHTRSVELALASSASRRSQHPSRSAIQIAPIKHTSATRKSNRGCLSDYSIRTLIELCVACSKHDGAAAAAADGDALKQTYRTFPIIIGVNIVVDIYNSGGGNRTVRRVVRGCSHRGVHVVIHVRRILQFIRVRLLSKAARSSERRSRRVKIHRDAAFFISLLFALQADGECATNRVTQSFTLCAESIQPLKQALL